LAPTEESDVEVIEAPLVKKRKLKKVAKPAAPVVEAVNVAGFLATRRKQAPQPLVAPLAGVEAFLANKPVEVSPVNAVELVLVEPLKVIGGLIPITSILG
jgi:hypothetical protein